jgi:hypothetical protein
MIVDELRDASVGALCLLSMELFVEGWRTRDDRVCDASSRGERLVEREKEGKVKGDQSSKRGKSVGSYEVDFPQNQCARSFNLSPINSPFSTSTSNPNSDNKH